MKLLTTSSVKYLYQVIISGKKHSRFVLQMHSFDTLWKGRHLFSWYLPNSTQNNLDGQIALHLRGKVCLFDFGLTFFAITRPLPPSPSSTPWGSFWLCCPCPWSSWLRLLSHFHDWGWALLFAFCSALIILLWSCMTDVLLQCPLATLTARLHSPFTCSLKALFAEL